MSSTSHGDARPDQAEIDAKRAARAAKKAAKRNEQDDGTPEASTSSRSFLKRDLVSAASEAQIAQWSGRRRLKLMTWNILAQCLVRRDLFPGSDCLKWSSRKNLTDQIVEYSPDVACLQEVDRLDDHGPILERAGYDIHHVIGGYEDEGKQHGLAIIWKRLLFRKVSDASVRLDELEFKGRTGLSRATRNIGLLCALEFVDDSETTEAPRRKGLIVGTLHAFWHARYTYERARQVGLLVREIRRFRRSSELGIQQWPTFLAGDFNIQPSEACYRFLTDTPLSPSQKTSLQDSRIVHSTVDKRNGTHRGDSAYVTMQGDEDRVFTNVRPAEEADGLLDEGDLEELHRSKRPLVSLYGRWGAKMQGQDGNYFKDRPRAEGQPPAVDGEDEEIRVRQGAFEPMWTNFTPLWRCTLDYIFHIPSDEPTSESTLDVAALLPTHRSEVTEPGLPRLGKEPSDHMALLADIVL